MLNKTKISARNVSFVSGISLSIFTQNVDESTKLKYEISIKRVIENHLDGDDFFYGMIIQIRKRGIKFVSSFSTID